MGGTLQARTDSDSGRASGRMHRRRHPIRTRARLRGAPPPQHRARASSPSPGASARCEALTSVRSGIMARTSVSSPGRKWTYWRSTGLSPRRRGTWRPRCLAWPRQNQRADPRSARTAGLVLRPVSGSSSWPVPRRMARPPVHGDAEQYRAALHPVGSGNRRFAVPLLWHRQRAAPRGRGCGFRAYRETPRPRARPQAAVHDDHRFRCVRMAAAAPRRCVSVFCEYG